MENNRRVKIVATIGPKTVVPEMLRQLDEAGMSIARLNGSHANLEWHANAINAIQHTLKNTPVLLDIPGRKIRTIMLAHEPKFQIGDVLIITSDQSHDGLEKIPVNYPDFHKDVSAGNTIMADDGTLKFTVLKVEEKDVYCRAETAGQLKSRKGINVPFVSLNTPLLTDRDKQMIEFACANKVNFIGLSFVESAKHIKSFQELINGRGPKIVAKVENQGGIDHLLEIVEATDAIMIDRGDLSVETSLYDVAIKQKQIIDAASRLGKPVIVATEMLHTMIENSFPTKAEISDITNAVLDGCAATMLSGETAVGLYPVESVRVMSQVISAAEEYLQRDKNKLEKVVGEGIPHAVSMSVPVVCETSGITKIVAITRSGYAARMIARHRLSIPIIAVTDEVATVKSLNLIAGTKGVLSPTPFSKKSTDHIAEALKMLWLSEEIIESDVVLVTGVSYPISGSRMNTVQVFKISDLRSALEWNR